MIRIVFVDDEAGVLQTMRRSLDGMGRDWNMVFASSGTAALEELAMAPADVIVADMHMPRMSGWQLLREVKIRYPQMLRLVSSGPAEPSSIMRMVGVAHHYLAKPCDSAALKTAIAQSDRLKHLLSGDRQALLAEHALRLSSAPQVFQEILACLEQPTTFVADAARIIGRGVSMTANVIRVANSTFSTSRQPVNTINRAVACLGLDTIGALVLGHSLFKRGAKHDILSFPSGRLWQHSLDTAVAAQTVALCEGLSPAKAEEAFLAGMLHDVGKVVFDAHHAPQMAEHHAGVGAYLLALWGFPSSIVEAVASHHGPNETETGGLSLPRLIHIADRLVHQRHAEYSGPFERGLEAGLLENLGLEPRWPKWLAALDSLDFGTVA